MVLNINIMIGIAVFVLAAIVSLWAFMPLFVEPIYEVPGSGINIEYSFWPTVSAGQKWELNVTLSNTGRDPAETVIVEVASDNVVSGDTEVVPSVPAGESVLVSLDTSIKKGAARGKYTAVVQVAVPGSPPKEKELAFEVV
ncbi:MAG: hypothetical protein JW834_00420 [Candidatus Diapherotrites archaeon]|nr:hypothetical protein [Candidatus Diapherotrites archaeon]